MAWLDDRAWCHPKLVALSDKAHRVHINAISYSSGMGLRGVLGTSHQRLMGATRGIRWELVEAGVWDDLGGDIRIHDWDVHNAKRDDRKERDRQRKRVERPRELPGEPPQDRTALTVSDRVTEVEPNGSTRERNPIWDALVQVFGEPSTDTARKLRGKVCSSLTRAGATHDEIIRRAKTWPRHFENATLTETALEKHWDALGRQPLRVER